MQTPIPSSGDPSITQKQYAAAKDARDGGKEQTTTDEGSPA
jgi:hypothetical protein